MSHNEQLSPDTQPSAASQSEYGVALSEPQVSQSQSADISPSKGTDRAHPAASEAMSDSTPLTSWERWAVGASESQFNALSGAVGGFTSGIVTCPLDVIKTKLQAQGGFVSQSPAGHTRVYKGLFGTASVIWNQEGLRGMYRGLGPIIMGYLPTWAVWFTVYNKSKRFLGEYHGTCLDGRQHLSLHCTD